MTATMPHPLHVDDADVEFYRDNGYFIYQNPLVAPQNSVE